MSAVSWPMLDGSAEIPQLNRFLYHGQQLLSGTNGPRQSLSSVGLRGFERQKAHRLLKLPFRSHATPSHGDVQGSDCGPQFGTNPGFIA